MIIVFGVVEWGFAIFHAVVSGEDTVRSGMPFQTVLYVHQFTTNLLVVVFGSITAVFSFASWLWASIL